MIKQDSVLYLTNNFRTGHLADVSQNIFESNSGVSRSSADGYGCTTRATPPAPFHHSYATACTCNHKFLRIQTNFPTGDPQQALTYAPHTRTYGLKSYYTQCDHRILKVPTRCSRSTYVRLCYFS